LMAFGLRRVHLETNGDAGQHARSCYPGTT
jgi:hypothetical protein